MFMLRPVGSGVVVSGRLLFWSFFFFKQKTAYEISACLVGSEMCIRDRYNILSNHLTGKEA